VVPESELEAELERWAQQIIRVPIRQLQAAKSGIHRQFELMGLANMECVQSRMSGHGGPEDMAWFQKVIDVGLQAALKERDNDFDDEISGIGSDLRGSNGATPKPVAH
jgi:hypothetical protein